ncbi:hypothetical protein ACO0LG_06910 [Undibacterium sp. Ji42W]
MVPATSQQSKPGLLDILALPSSRLMQISDKLAKPNGLSRKI